MVMKEIELKELKALLESDITLLDVRSKDEYNEIHIKGALHIPLPELSLRINELNKDAKVITICARGGRAYRAGSFLLDNGFFNVCYVKGDYEEWEDFFLPVVKAR